MDDSTLWDDFRAGDEQAFAKLFLTYYDDLFSYGRKLAVDEELVKDCIQNLFQKLWRRREALKPIRIVKPYLYKSLRRHITDETAVLRRSTLFSSTLFDEFDVVYSHEDFLVAQQLSREQSEKLLLALNHLSNRQREAIYLKYFDGFSYEKISEVMALNPQSARNLIYQALKLLKDALLIIVLLLHYA